MALGGDAALKDTASLHAPAEGSLSEAAQGAAQAAGETQGRALSAQSMGFTGSLPATKAQEKVRA